MILVRVIHSSSSFTWLYCTPIRSPNGSIQVVQIKTHKKTKQNNLVFQMNRCNLSASRASRCNRPLHRAVRLNHHGERSSQETTISTAAGVLTSELPRRTGLPTQPLEKRAHHLGTAEALEARAHVPVVPLQRADLEHPAKTSGR